MCGMCVLFFFGLGSYWCVSILLYQVFQTDADCVTFVGEAWVGITKIINSCNSKAVQSYTVLSSSKKTKQFHPLPDSILIIVKKTPQQSRTNKRPQQQNKCVETRKSSLVAISWSGMPVFTGQLLCCSFEDL